MIHRFALLFALILALAAAPQSASADAAAAPASSPDEMLAEDVLVELPEAPKQPGARGTMLGIPLIVVAPFAGTAAMPDEGAAAGFGVAARLVDDYYRLKSVRAVTMETLAKAAGGKFLESPGISAQDALIPVAKSLGANYAVTGVVNLKSSFADVSATVFDMEGKAVVSASAGGSQSLLPALVSEISFKLLAGIGAALTDAERDYLDQGEPYSVDSWLLCNQGLRIVTAMQGGIETTKEQRKAAKDALDKCLKQSPDYLRARDALGRLHFAEAEYEKARSVFTELSTRSPKYAPARFYLGVIAYREGKIAAAKKELGRAVELDSGDPASWLYYGLAQIADGQPASAEQSLRQGLKLSPDGVELRFALGRSLMLQERYSEAAEEFEKVVLVRPQTASAQYNLGLCYYRIRDFSKAERHFRIYLDLTPGDPEGDHAKVKEWIAAMNGELD